MFFFLEQSRIDLSGLSDTLHVERARAFVSPVSFQMHVAMFIADAADAVVARGFA